MWLYVDMDEEYKTKYRTTPARLKGWDYGANGLYFITICTKDRNPYFGAIIKDNQNIPFLQKTAIGHIAKEYWLSIPKYSPYIDLDEFIIMPDHLHGVLFINKPNKTGWDLNKFGVQTLNLASAIRGYKSSIKKYANANEIDSVAIWLLRPGYKRCKGAPQH